MYHTTSPSRPARPVQIQGEIDDVLIEKVVRHFYQQVRLHPQLGPLFENRIQDGWEDHLQKMMDFWSSVLLTSGRYKGEPMRKHLALKDVRPEHFAQWLSLFRRCVSDLCSEEDAKVFMDRAERIANSLQLGMFGVPELRGTGS